MPRALPFCLLLLLAIGGAAVAEAGTYMNQQFGYSIHYPSSLLRPAASHSGAGQSFVPVVGHAGFRVYAARLSGRSPRELANDAQAICPGGRPSYRVAKPALVAISCRAGDHIIYQKSLLRGELEITVRGEYPEKERWIWDRVVSSIARSMSAAPLETSYPDLSPPNAADEP